MPSLTRLRNYAKALVSPIYNRWARLSNKYDGYRNNEAILRLKYAYSRVLRGKGADSEDCELVLCDLAMMTGYYRVTRPGSNIDLYQLGFNEGKRAVFQHIVEALNLNPTMLASLQDAVELEQQFIEYNKADYS